MLKEEHAPDIECEEEQKSSKLPDCACVGSGCENAYCNDGGWCTHFHVWVKQP